MIRGGGKVFQYLLQRSTLSTADFIPSGRILPSMHETPLLVSPPIGHLYFGAVVVVGAGGAGVGLGVGVGVGVGV